MSGPWDRPSRDPEDTWPSEDADATTPPAPEQPTDDPWASRDLWPEPSREASPGWDDWPTQPAQDDYLGEEPPPPVLSDPWAESWSDDASMAPAPRDAWSEPAAQRPPFEHYPERVEPRVEPQPESEPEAWMAEPAASSWERPDEAAPLSADLDAEMPAAVPLEPWSPDADPWAAAVVEVEPEADGADDEAPESEPAEAAAEQPERQGTGEEGSLGEVAPPVEENEREAQPFAGAFSGLGRAARTVLPDWLAEPHPPDPEPEREPELEPEGVPEREPESEPEAPGEIAGDAERADMEQPGQSGPDIAGIEAARADDETPDSEEPDRPRESVVTADEPSSDPAPAVATDGPEATAPDAPAARPWWRSVGPWASPEAADDADAGGAESAMPRADGAAGGPIEDHTGGEPDAATSDDGGVELSQSAGDAAKASGPEHDHAEHLDPAAHDAGLDADGAQSEDLATVAPASIPPAAPIWSAPAEPTADLTPEADESVDDEESAPGPDEASADAAAPSADTPDSEPQPDAWPSMDVSTAPARTPEPWTDEVPGGASEPDPDVDVRPAIDEPPWPTEPTNAWATRSWEADAADADAADAEEIEAPVDDVGAAADVEPSRWDDPARPAVESTQVLPTSWVAARPDPGVAPRPDEPLDPVGGDIRTRLGTAEPDIDLDEEGEPKPTTAEQAVPWLIGFILLLAGMVIVLLALIFAGEESLGGSGASPSASAQIGLVSESASASPAATRTPSPAPSRSAASTAPSVVPTPTPVALPEYGPLEILYQGRSAALAPIYLLHREFTVEQAPEVLAQDPNLDVRRFAWAPDGSVGVALYSDVLVSVEIGTEKRRLGDGLSTVTFGDDAATVYAVRVTQDGGNDVATVVAIDFASADTRDIASVTYARPDLGAEESLVEAQFADDGGAVRLHWTQNDTLRLWAAGAGAWEITPDDGAVTEAGTDLPLMWAPDGRTRVIVQTEDGQTTLRHLDEASDTIAATTIAGIVSHVRWSPSGDRVVFTVGRSASGGGILQDLFLWDLEQSVAPTQLTSTGAAFGAEWRGSQARWEAP